MCNIPGCNEPLYSKGMCKQHYMELSKPPSKKREYVRDYWWNNHERYLRQKREWYHRSKAKVRWISIRIPRTLHARIKNYAALREDSVNDLVNILLEWGLDEFDKKSTKE